MFLHLALLGAALAADPPKNTKSVVAGEQYKAGGSHRYFWGGDYRDLWTTAATLEVLDLQAEAGGLSPVRRVGGQQTKGLALKGRDGRAYTFRGLEKDPSELLEEDLRGTIAEKILDDQMAAQHPGGEVVARVLLEAAGVPVPAWRLVVMPDDPALGAFQKDFAGEIGMFAEYPTPRSDTYPGFLDAAEIVDHLTLYKRLAAGTGERADTDAFLRARLMDLFMGDWDRHRKQWRWARKADSPVFFPIPEDRDQAFSRYEGVFVGIGRQRDPRFQAFSPKYSRIEGLANNGREQDRQLLAEIPRERYVEMAKELQGRLGDAVIEAAVKVLPPEWAALDGPRFTAALRARRDSLPAVAQEFHRHVSERADVFLSDQAETIQATRHSNGDLELSASPSAGSGASFRRVFHPAETREVRVYTLGGDDRLTVTGGEGPIRLRMIGGAGKDRLDDTAGGGVRLSDDQGESVVAKGPGTSEDDRAYEPPPTPKTAPWVTPRDYGTDLWGVPWVTWGSDIGVFLGGGVERRSYAFRKHPYAASHVLRAGYAFEAETGRADYKGLFPRENSKSLYGIVAYASGVETLRYYGLGNETTSTDDSDFFKAKEEQYLLYLSYNWRLADHTVLSLGAAGRYSDSAPGQENFIDAEKPYGYGSFGQVGVHTTLIVDTRDNLQYPRKGFRLGLRGTLFPEALDVQKTFGGVSGEASAYLSAGKWLTLALRGGGAGAFGDYTFRDAAYIGGGGLSEGALQAPEFTLRGYRANRFGGDGSVFGNSDLRLRLGRITIFIPMHVGVFGLADVGRVFLKGEDSDTWHTSLGGGVWVSLLNYRATFSAYLAHSKESDVFHVGGGFSF